MSFQSAQNKTHGHLLPHRDGNLGTGTRSRASVRLKDRLENPNVTYFQVKQAVISRRVSHAILPPSVL
jgi:hypothetical protein